MADKLSGRTSDGAMGIWMVEASATTGWVANNSPNDLDLSGLTEGLSYVHFNRISEHNEKYSHLFKAWHYGDGKKDESTYGDDDGFHTFFHKFTGSTRVAVYTAQKYSKKFFKKHNRGSADRVYLFNRLTSSADGYEYFVADALSYVKYAPVLPRDDSYSWTESSPRLIVGRFIIEEVFPDV